MSRDILLTAMPVRVSATGAQDLRLALEVLAFDELDLELRVLLLEGTASPSVTIEVQTGMQRESTVGWVTLTTFTAVSAPPSSEKKNLTGLLRYVRWNVTTLTGTSPAATFAIHGVGRSWGEAVGDAAVREGGVSLGFPLESEREVPRPGVRTALAALAPAATSASSATIDQRLRRRPVLG